jgi:hypothetical protein
VIIRIFLILLGLSALALLQAERWKMQFFHDEDNSRIAFSDLVFPTEKTGIACGVLSNERTSKGIVLLTRDGGTSWQRQDVLEIPLSLYFVNESVGFMVTAKGLWRTEERGLVWKKLKSWNTVARVHFFDTERGIAYGPNRTLLRTQDGGKTWNPIPEAQKLSSNTTFAYAAFQGQLRGIVIGSSIVPRRDAPVLPEFLDPAAAAGYREWPGISSTLETGDGGKTWEPQTTPVFGRMKKLRFVPDGLYGLSILNFERSFEVPSESYLVNWKNGKSESTYRAPGRYIEDVGFLTPTTGLLAVIERPGKLMNSPFPGKLRMLKATDLRSWIEMPVDYRATGSRAMLATVNERNAWVALDSGMILKLEP